MKPFIYKAFSGIAIILCATCAIGNGLAHMSYDQSRSVANLLGIICIIICAIFTFVLGIYMLVDAYQTHKDELHEVCQEE